ncbi:hypothetical protein ACNKXS_15320, partial [Christiangramia marina]|uniref:hypothetical protein n=1 Tax=Christiangramia marina TaxID=409436 RepID=UPI003AA93CEB
MNELPNHPEQAAPANAAGPALQKSPSHPSHGGGLQALLRPLPLAVAALAVLLAVQTVTSHSRINTLRRDMALSLQKGNAVNAERQCRFR